MRKRVFREAREWGDRVARVFDPFVNDNFCVRDGMGVSLAVGHATGQFRHFDDETSSLQ